MLPFGPTELIILLVIVVLIFGVGKLSQVGGALGQGIRDFRKATAEETVQPAVQTLSAASDSTTAP